MSDFNCNQVCPLNTLNGCKKDELNDGVCLFAREENAEQIGTEKDYNGETICHCNKKQNAELIAKILDADLAGEVFEIDNYIYMRVEDNNV